MIKIGITGGIGSGKSIVSRLFEIMGIPVYISDIEAKRLTATDPLIRKELIALLGEEVFKGGVLNKPYLANYLFSDPAHAKNINSIIHPRVKEDFRKWAECQANKPLVAMESAILIEAGFKNEIDTLFMVYAPLEIRIKRAMERDNATQQQIQERITHQMSDEEKKLQADFIILNDDRTALIPQVESAIERLYANINS